jgi:hypothetical protein
MKNTGKASDRMLCSLKIMRSSKRPEGTLEIPSDVLDLERHSNLLITMKSLILAQDER